jgi:prepilin-type N-terminal cleavage/methylation domain-containing protein
MTQERSEGFSLVELMIAITILGIGVLSLAGLYPVAMQRVHAGDIESRATFHGQAKIEELKSLPWTQLRTTVGADSLEGFFARTWRVQEDEPVMGMKQIQVGVQWQDSHGSRSVSLSSFLSDSGM